MLPGSGSRSSSSEAKSFISSDLPERLTPVNMAFIMEEAELSRDGGADLIEEGLDIERDVWVWFSHVCYLQRTSPEQGVLQAIERFLNEFEPTLTRNTPAELL